MKRKTIVSEPQLGSRLFTNVDLKWKKGKPKKEDILFKVKLPKA